MNTSRIAARVELLRVLREQAVSRILHRYGHVPRRYAQPQ